jgi:EpsI family protein
MSKTQWTMLATVWLLVGVSSAFLLRMQSSHNLGLPGLKMVDLPVYDTAGNIVNTNTIDLPEFVLNYTSHPLPVTQTELDWLPQDTTYGRRAYKAPDDFGIMLSVVLMGKDRSSIHKPEICLTGQGWKITDSDHLSVFIDRPHPYELPVSRLMASKQVDGTTWRSIYVFWFVADGQITAGYGDRMWRMARELLRTGTLQRWAYVACLAYCAPGQEEITFERMKEFIAASVPEFQIAAGTPPTVSQETRHHAAAAK